MGKRTILNLIKRQRVIRDAVVSCDNSGRQRQLLMKFQDVKSVITQTGWSSYIEIKLHGGWEYRYEGLNYNEVAEYIYSKWRDNYLLNRKTK